MTTLCYCDGVLATDSRMTCEGYITSDTTTKLWDLRDKEIFYMHDRLLAIALGGRINHFDWYLHYLQRSDFPHPEFTTHCVVGIIVGEKAVYEIEKEAAYLVRYSLDSHVAVGSGEDYARSAMALGKGAKQAIKHARKFDTATGGEVQWVKLFSQ